MEAVLFDLDDTLYDEMTFVRGGFWAAARSVAGLLCVRPEVLFQDMMQVLASTGRGKVFNLVLKMHGHTDEALVSYMINLYRSHSPSIEPFAEVVPTFRKLRAMGCMLGIITDGLASIQRRKVKALNLRQYVDAVVFSDELGPEHWKPDPLPFVTALLLLNKRPCSTAYVGDNPAKDFSGANRVGLTTFHVQRNGRCRFYGCDAHFHIPSLARVVDFLVQRRDI